jgi:hypothetical protein
MSDPQYKAYLRVRSLATREIVHNVGLTSLNERRVERVMLGLLRNMDTNRFFVDASEVDEAREKEGEPR